MAQPLDYLRPFVNTKNELEIFEASERNGWNIAAAARDLGCAERNFRRRLAKLKNKAALQGVSPDHNMVHAAPDAFTVKGVSTLYDGDGEVKAQWVKTQQSGEDKLSAVAEAIEAAMDGYRGVYKPRKAPKSDSDDLLACYVMGDPHIGAYAHAEEAGENFDVKIAREDLLNATSRLVQVAPKTERALVLNLGDFFHADNASERTNRSGAKLDVDTRWHRVLQAGCMLMVDLITLALSKHPVVEVINCIGNHDDHSSVMLSAFLGAYFHNEPRVIVHPTVNKFHYLQHGKVLIAATHGDSVKTTALSELMATDQPQLWADTEHRYWYTGHIHHTTRQELRGCVQESFRTLAAKDAWHHNSGYRSGRDMFCIVHSKEYGEVERYRCDIRRARSG
jgi:hypothetical protein